MKKTIRILLILASIIAIIFATNHTYALSGSQIKGSADNWIQQGSANTPIKTQEAWNKLSPIASILVSIASVVLVISYMYMGIKYMIADPSGKADVKTRLIWLVVATVLIYGAVGIFTLIVNLMTSILS